MFGYTKSKYKFVRSVDISNERMKELTVEVNDQHNIGPQTEVPVKSMKYYLINYKTKIKKLYHFFLSEKILH